MGCGGSKKKVEITPEPKEGAEAHPVTENPVVAGESARVEAAPSSRPPASGRVFRSEYNMRHSGRSNPTGGATAEPTPLPLPTAEEARTEDEREVLKVLNVDFNITQNATRHRTYFFENTEERVNDDGKKCEPQLVVRRGQPFDITLEFDRPFDGAKDDIRLIFDVGDNPRETKGTKVVLMLSDKDLPKKWGATVLSNEGASLSIRIFTPPRAAVAKWNFHVDAVIKKADVEKVFRYNHHDHIYILFNPWCSDDQVYMDDETSRVEYVLNDHGKVYRGTKKNIHPKPWNFGQFEDFMLDCIFHLLDESKMNWAGRNNPTLVCRKISALANAPDDNGILIGNWSGDYSGGTSPLAWCGSVRIMEQYWKTLRPVSYGQCWVFSGVVTTICRALGIPCRSTTNFASAHDCDGSITIDDYWTPEGKPMEDLNEDSVWNFHVWNEVWMARPDLPPGYGGWQAIDATPQETSDGVYCCGPASLEALKNGLVHLPYDGPFVFAEVNADRVHWIQKPEGGWHPQKQVHAVGKSISTKSPYNEERMDITNVYKYAEGSQQERTAVWRAAQEGSTRKDVYTSEIEDMTFELLEKELVKLGNPYNVTFRINNNSDQERNVKVTLTSSVVFYTGVPAGKIKSENYSISASVGAAGEITMTVDPEEYVDKLVDMCQLKISCMAQVVETKQFYCDSDVFRLVKPDIEVKAPEEARVGTEFEIQGSFTNPMNKTLTACEFQVEGPGLQRPLIVKHPAVLPHEEARFTATIKPKKAGQKKVIVGFDSLELSDLAGEALITVNK